MKRLYWTVLIIAILMATVLGGTGQSWAAGESPLLQGQPLDKNQPAHQQNNITPGDLKTPPKEKYVGRNDLEVSAEKVEVLQADLQNLRIQIQQILGRISALEQKPQTRVNLSDLKNQLGQLTDRQKAVEEKIRILTAKINKSAGEKAETEKKLKKEGKNKMGEIIALVALAGLFILALVVFFHRQQPQQQPAPNLAQQAAVQVGALGQYAGDYLKSQGGMVFPDGTIIFPIVTRQDKESHRTARAIAAMCEDGQVSSTICTDLSWKTHDAPAGKAVTEENWREKLNEQLKETEEEADEAQKEAQSQKARAEEAEKKAQDLAEALKQEKKKEKTEKEEEEEVKVARRA